MMEDRREHDTAGRDCWCGPQFYRVCDDCDAGCWKCERGLILVTPEEAEAIEAPMVIVHN
jgi:hypothetical protein